MRDIFFNIMFFFQIFNTKWVSSSRDVVALRQSMLRADKCAEFRAYVATKGETLESDVLFWLEVQKYKVTCLLCDKFSFLRGGREGGRETYCRKRCTVLVEVQKYKSYKSNAIQVPGQVVKGI